MLRSGEARTQGGETKRRTLPEGHRPPRSEATHGTRTHDLCFTKALLYH